MMKVIFSVYFLAVCNLHRSVWMRERVKSRDHLSFSLSFLKLYIHSLRFLFLTYSSFLSIVAVCFGMPPCLVLGVLVFFFFKGIYICFFHK